MRFRRVGLLRCTCFALLGLLAFAVPASSQSGSHEFFVSPQGSDSGDGSSEHPFVTLLRAQQAVREHNRSGDVSVHIEDGTYRLAAPVRFTAADGGQNGHRVIWQAATDAHPVLNGAVKVQGWSLFDRALGIYVAHVPPHTSARQLWVDGQLAPIAAMEVPRKNLEFTREGLTVKAAPTALPDLSNSADLEVRATGFFTSRIAPVERVSGSTLVMRQPAWDNNLWGYDTIEHPYHPELQHIYLQNSLALLKNPGQWYLDRSKGLLYVAAEAGANLDRADVELPILTTLVSVGNDLAAPVHDLTFRGVTFSYTSWAGPSGSDGYPSQQSGAFLAGRAPEYPTDPIHTCAEGCVAFESQRNEWHQMPASVQVSAVEHVIFDHDTFEHLGQYALGIGNDADAMLSGTGLGASDVVVTNNLFRDCAGGAILAGGVQREAHHPSTPQQINRDLIIRNNRIDDVSKSFPDESAILSTYVEGAVILHNEISNVPYDAIDIGYGWGIQDPGGNTNYRVRMHGYDWPQNIVYTTPTTHHDVVVAANKIHDAKTLFQDGGAIYNLSASPHTLITENYIYDNHGMIALYLDEGSRYITVRRNVVDDPASEWLNINTVRAVYPLRISPDNLAAENWHNGTKVGGMWTNYQNDLIINDHLVTNNDWPDDARQVIKDSGIEPGAGPGSPWGK